MWPTPRTAQGSRPNGKGGKVLEEEVLISEGIRQRGKKISEMFLTPSANEDAAGRVGGKMQKMLGNSPEVRNTGKGTLSAEWVELLMGYPKGWTDIGEMDGKKVHQELPKGKKTEPTDLKD
jgi:hypothetical protein